MKYPKSYLQYATQYPKAEVINWSFWDTLLYTGGATLQLNFFQALGATLDISNMQAAGQLPFPQAFFVRAIRFYVKHRPWSVNAPGAPAAGIGSISDVALLLNTAALTLFIGSKDYGVYPLWAIPAGGGPWGALNVSNILVGGASVDYGNAGIPHARNLLTLAEPLFIPPQMNFMVSIVWGAAVAQQLNPTLTVCLEGDLIRPVQ